MKGDTKCGLPGFHPDKTLWPKSGETGIGPLWEPPPLYPIPGRVPKTVGEFVFRGGAPNCPMCPKTMCPYGCQLMCPKSPKSLCLTNRVNHLCITQYPRTGRFVPKSSKVRSVKRSEIWAKVKTGARGKIRKKAWLMALEYHHQGVLALSTQEQRIIKRNLKEHGKNEKEITAVPPWRERKELKVQRKPPSEPEKICEFMW